MKKFYILTVFIATLFAYNTSFVKAQQSPTASTQIFDWAPFNEVQMVNLFYNALQQGRNYPTEAELREVFGFDIEFARSHVRLRQPMLDQAKQLDPSINPNRTVWMNLPTGIGKEIGGYPASLFNNDVYSMWPYTQLFGAWNHGLFQAPGTWGDAAHKHGTHIYSGIKFFESWTPGSGDATYQGLITTQNPDGTFKYAEAFINILMYLGLDGINYNWEDNGYTNASVVAFHKELFRIAEEKGFDNFRIGLYTQTSGLTNFNAPNLYYGHTPSQKTIDLMLNYSGGDFATGSTATSIAAANNVGQTKHIYSGVWIVTMNRSWTQMNADNRKAMNLCLWGEHGQSRFMSYNAGTDAVNIQGNYQKLLERTFSGGYRNPANKPALSNTGNNWELEDGQEPLATFGGLASFVAERTTIQGKLPFYTNFQLGNGERYHYKGKKTFGNWYNMGAQDYQPTYRWLVYNANTTTVSSDIQPAYTHSDAYTGGSTLELTGTATASGTDIILYRADLEISEANPQVTLAVKNFQESVNPSHLYIILRKKDNSSWIEIPYGDISGKTWEEKTLPLSGFYKDEHIEYIGLRVKAPANTPNYKLYVGKLALTDDRLVHVAEVENLMVEVKEETRNSMTMKLNWKVNPLQSSAYAESTGMVYNDEAHVDHFEIMYKNGENGSVKEIARTSSWSNLIGGIIFDDSNAPEQPYIGVRAASIDKKSYSHVKWVKVDRAQPSQLPESIDDRYCISEINPNAEGADIAQAQRFITEVKTTGLAQNLNYTASAPQSNGTQYVNATNQEFTVTQGQSFDFFFKVKEGNDGLKYCIAKVYIDYDGNGNFEIDREEVINIGQPRVPNPEFENPGVTRTLAVPADAKPGQTRMRMVFSDAWFTHPGPCGLTSKGFTIDFTVNITGENTPYVTVDTHDQGQADEPDKIHDENPNAPDPNSINEYADYEQGGYSIFYPNPAENLIRFENTQEVWIYTLEGKLVFTQKGNLESVNVAKLVPGIYLVKMLNKQVVRNRKLIKK